jgi:hypothetical protein
MLSAECRSLLAADLKLEALLLLANCQLPIAYRVLRILFSFAYAEVKT